MVLMPISNTITPIGSTNFRLVDLTDDFIKVNMQPPVGTSRRDHVLTVPLEFIKAAWRDQKVTSQSPYLAIVLDAEIIWDRDEWFLISGPSR
jgi:hypothetical protein